MSSVFRENQSFNLCNSLQTQFFKTSIIFLEPTVTLIQGVLDLQK